MVSPQSAIDLSMKALSDHTRRGILALLRQGQLSVLEIAEEFPMSRPAISKHLRILREAGLVVETPAGRQRIYGLEAAPLKSVELWLEGFNGSSRSNGGTKGRSGEGVPRRGYRGVTSDPATDWRVW